MFLGLSNSLRLRRAARPTPTLQPNPCTLPSFCTLALCNVCAFSHSAHMIPQLTEQPLYAQKRRIATFTLATAECMQLI